MSLRKQENIEIVKIIKYVFLNSFMKKESLGEKTIRWCALYFVVHKNQWTPANEIRDQIHEYHYSMSFSTASLAKQLQHKDYHQIFEASEPSDVHSRRSYRLCKEFYKILSNKIGEAINSHVNEISLEEILCRPENLQKRKISLMRLFYEALSEFKQNS